MIAQAQIFKLTPSGNLASAPTGPATNQESREQTSITTDGTASISHEPVQGPTTSTINVEGPPIIAEKPSQRPIASSANGDGATSSPHEQSQAPTTSTADDDGTSINPEQISQASTPSNTNGDVASNISQKPSQVPMADTAKVDTDPILPTQGSEAPQTEPKSGPSTLPGCLRNIKTFAGRTNGLPACANIIAMPNSLLDQWAAEIPRFMKPGSVYIHRVTSVTKDWESDMDDLRELIARRGQQVIVLITHSVLARMYSRHRSQLEASITQGTPRLKYGVPSSTIFSFDFLSMWIDEVHEARTGKALWRAISALSLKSLVKVYRAVQLFR
ncbi:DNA helicase rad5 [Marasmius tenuissimus]|uniref:DNA helicase rad5 n=1 Tax=Marasmius tenuissimus TaxID=585030 RepID=A0ABR2ZSW9_9AGAR